MPVEASDSDLAVIGTKARRVSVIQLLTKPINIATDLVKFASNNYIPVLFTERNPEGFGSTVSEILKSAGQSRAPSMSHIKCTEAPVHMNAFTFSNGKRVDFCGMETHPCVEQKSANLALEDHETFRFSGVSASRSSSSENAYHTLLSPYHDKLMTRRGTF